MGRLHGVHGMTDRSDELRDALVTILLDTLEEHGIETVSYTHLTLPTNREV